MAPFVKPSWLALLCTLTLVFIANAAAVESTAVGANLTDAGPNLTANSSTEPDTKGNAAKVEVDINQLDALLEGNNLTSTVAPVNSTVEQPAACSILYRRQEWRDMTRAAQSAYINAVRCLQTRLGPISGIPGSRSRFDDFQGLHIQLTPQVHQVGQFLPWHRWYMFVYEATMRNQCGYTGAQPYWDWSRDISNFPNSPVFNANTGFGNLVTRGPVPNDHRLERSYNPTMLQYITQAQVNAVLALPNFERFRIELEGRPATPLPRIHDAGHVVVGGDLGDTYSSPGDPLFFLHHANLDRIWWRWQNSRPGRLNEISGRSTTTPPFRQVTLDTLLPMGRIGLSTAIRSVMDIQNSLCYTYV